MRAVSILLFLTCLYVSPAAQAQHNAPPPPDRLVVVGDSLSAGVQNFSLLGSQQPNGYASLVAKQVGWQLTLPLVPYPGVPNVLEVKPGLPITIGQASGVLPAPRENPFIQSTNIAVPGLTVPSALTLRPSSTASDPEQQWATVVLGFPNLYQGKAPTEIELALALKPKTLIEWLGNNDALVPALVGELAGLTPPVAFDTAYKQILDSLSTTGARLITATVPDVTEVAFFTSAQTIAKNTKLPLSTVTSMLGIGPDDYIRPSAQTYVDGILTGHLKGPIPANCPSPLPDLGTSVLPCVLTQTQAQTVRATVNCYNESINNLTTQHGGTVVDINGLVNNIYSEGYKLPDVTLTTDFFGGLFSLDGIHPTNAGYAVIANAFLSRISALLGRTIPPVDVANAYATDPLLKYATPDFVARPVPPAAACPVSLPSAAASSSPS